MITNRRSQCVNTGMSTDDKRHLIGKHGPLYRLFKHCSLFLVSFSYIKIIMNLFNDVLKVKCLRCSHNLPLVILISFPNCFVVVFFYIHKRIQFNKITCKQKGKRVEPQVLKLIYGSPLQFTITQVTMLLNLLIVDKISMHVKPVGHCTFGVNLSFLKCICSAENHISRIAF